MRLVPINRAQSTLCGWLLLGLSVIAATGRAEQLPIKTYTRANGLADDYIGGIEQDSRGFLWFCTARGLSRFDGYRFTTYGQEQGLFTSYYDLLETRSGVYWIASNGGGVYRFDPQASSLALHPERLNANPHSNAQADTAARLFTAYAVGDEPASNRVNVLHEDRAGRIWAGTDGGLFILDKTDDAGKFLRVELGVPTHPDRLVQVWTFVEDREGCLWIATKFGLVRRLPDGRMVHYAIRSSRDRDFVGALLEDREGRLWVGHESMGLIVFKPPPISLALTAKGFPWRRLIRAREVKRRDAQLLLNAPGEAILFTTADGLAGNHVNTLVQSSDGSIWVGTNNGLSRFDGAHFRNYTSAHGLSSNFISVLKEDRDGGLWIGSPTAGGMRLAKGGFVSYLKEDGLGSNYCTSISENPSGELYVTTSNGYINRLNGERFVAIRPNLSNFGAETSFNRILQDHAGEWWLPTRRGLLRFPKLSRFEQLTTARPKAIYTTRNGLADNDVRRIYEDSRGDIWINSFAPGREVVTRWERATGKFHHYSDADGLPPFQSAWSFREDQFGNVWIGFRDGPLARYTTAGRFTVFKEDDGLPAGEIRDLYLDRAGRLWIAAARGGLSRIEDLASEHPRFVTYTTAKGFISNDATCITEDEKGNIYAGTHQGIERLDPATNTVKHYTAADGLYSIPEVAHRDRYGSLWFGSPRGLFRLIPEPETHSLPPSVLIGGLYVAGVQQPLFELGESEVSELALRSDQNHIQIDFFSLSVSQAEAIRYRFKIDGVDKDWGAPTEQRSVNLSLAPGTYRFIVQAIGADGAISESPASVAFSILPPIWQRWWFIAIVVVIGGLVIYVIARYRVARLVELERMRTRIATDLHDDIGAGLSRIAILSEVAHRRLDGGDAEVGEPLSTITGASRELVDSMSDIVWAIDPQKEHLHDLTQRMRRFASDLFTARNIEFGFQLPGLDHDIKLSADVRRQVFLIFKESVNNLIRHSQCTLAEVELRIEEGWLALKVSDNGKGFDTADGSDGHGLMSLRQRAKRLKAELEVVSNKGNGTTLMLRVPLSRRASKERRKTEAGLRR